MTLNHFTRLVNSFAPEKCDHLPLFASRDRPLCLLFFVILFLFVLFSQQGKGVAPKKDPASTLQYLLGPLPKLNVSGHLLGVQLMSVNAYLHTSILYGQWEGWQGKPVDEPPLFYNGLTESTADLLSSISDEIVSIARVIELKTEADLSHVRYFYEFIYKNSSFCSNVTFHHLEWL